MQRWAKSSIPQSLPTNPTEISLQVRQCIPSMIRYYALLLAVFAALAASFWFGYIPLFLAVSVVLINGLTYVFYAVDKRSAMKGRWRVPESRLHLLGVLGGWPSALLAQQTFRHKTKKVRFRTVFWLTVLLNVGFSLWLHLPQGNHLLRQAVHRLENFAEKTLPWPQVQEWTAFMSFHDV
ncbi:DUF1294 domain-containing protein [Halioxenophilus aromaticivorans]